MKLKRKVTVELAEKFHCLSSKSDRILLEHCGNHFAKYAKNPFKRRIAFELHVTGY